jgi:hypothetical protein
LLRFEPITDGAARFATVAEMFRVGALGNLPMRECSEASACRQRDARDGLGMIDI